MNHTSIKLGPKKEDQLGQKLRLWINGDPKISTRQISQIDEGFPKKEERRDKQSGVDVEYGELDHSIQDIKERVAEFEELKEGEEQKQKKQKAAMEKMRRQATEKLSETKKRKATLEDPDTDDKILPGKKEKSTSMVDVVQQTIELKKWHQEHDDEIKKRELDLRASEMQQQ